MNLTFNWSSFKQAFFKVSPPAFAISPSLRSVMGKVTASLLLSFSGTTLWKTYKKDVLVLIYSVIPTESTASLICTFVGGYS